MSRFHRAYGPSLIALLAKCATLDEVKALVDQVTQARESGGLDMSSGTYRKLWAKAHDRCAAIKKATLYGSDNRPLV